MIMGWDRSERCCQSLNMFERLSIDIWNHVVVQTTLRLKLCFFFFFPILLVLDGREERFVE